MSTNLYIKAVPSGPAPHVLPSGTYIPKSSVVGPFDLLWEGVTANSSSSDGAIKKISGFGVDWDGSGWALIDHNGDFELNFTFNHTNGSNCLFGLCYYKPGDYVFDLDFAFRFGSGSLVYPQESLHVYDDESYTSEVLSIKRIGHEIKYFVGDAEVRSVVVYNSGPIILTTSLFDEVFIENIEVIIP